MLSELIVDFETIFILYCHLFIFTFQTVFIFMPASSSLLFETRVRFFGPALLIFLLFIIRFCFDSATTIIFVYQIYIDMQYILQITMDLNFSKKLIN